MSDKQRVPVRRDFLIDTFENLRSLIPELYDDQTLDDVDAEILASLYFVISDAYKEYRIAPGHRTNEYKRAGVTIAAVMILRPFRPVDSADEKAFYLNQIYAAYCASGILGRPLSAMDHEARDHLYSWLDTLRLPCTETFLTDAVAGVRDFDDSYGKSMSYVEVSQLDMLAGWMKMFCESYDAKAGAKSGRVTSEPV